jgi:hypothetical protein
LWIRRRLETRRLQSELEEPSCLLIGQLLERPSSGAARITNSLVNLSGWSGMREVMCELGEV